MKVLALSSYPVEAAATRYRLTQFVAPLAERGITMEVRPFLDSSLFASLYRRAEMWRTGVRLLDAWWRRFGDVWRARDFDVLLVQREAMLFGPPVIEWLSMRFAGCPMVLDLDDATYLSYISPVYGRLVSRLKWFGKTDDLIRWAKIVTCGNRNIADYVAGKGVRSLVIPTVVDTEQFRPAATIKRKENEELVLGWIGTHSTFEYLETIFPALQQLARTRPFRLKVIGAGRDSINLPGVTIENLPWSMEREIADFQSLDIGLYPLVESPWAAGKSGFKAIQYMAVGVPYVVTPVGASGEIGVPGETHLCATTVDEWRDALATLLTSADLRARMGEAGRLYAVRHYNVAAQADKLAGALREAALL